MPVLPLVCTPAQCALTPEKHNARIESVSLNVDMGRMLGTLDCIQGVGEEMLFKRAKIEVVPSVTSLMDLRCYCSKSMSRELKLVKHPSKHLSMP
jgi:hypothetical protein